MFDKITYMSNSECHLHIKENVSVAMNLMNMHFVFDDGEKKILGEISDLDGSILKVRFLGEIQGNQFISGTIRKPNLNSQVRFINKDELPLIMGREEKGFFKLGKSPLYEDSSIYLPVNSFFSNHFAIFGNTGSGKSCGVSRIFQNMFLDDNLKPYNSHFFIFDSSGEYKNAFSHIHNIDSKYHYRFISTSNKDSDGESLKIPIYLLNRDDLALLLQCNSHTQLPIIERMLKLAIIFSQNDQISEAYKNYLIAKAIMTILYTNETASNKRNEIFSILASCSTKAFYLDAPIRGIGYVRKFRECFLIDNTDNFTESVLLTEYISSFIKEEFEHYEPKNKDVFYTLDTLEKALNFTLISEGWLRNEQTYADAVTLRVRLHSLIVGENAKFFDVDSYIALDNYLNSFTHENGNKYQIININLDDIDDELAKTITKIFSRMLFDTAKNFKVRASKAYHIVLEEAHRYIQHDQDRFLFGYNIFERIAKEGRKYGVVLGLISQRPGEISDTVISQCTNFLIFKLNHPTDLQYLREMVPHITDEIIEKQKALQPGTCLGFGLGFKIPLIVKMEMPDPSPLSSSGDMVNLWGDNGDSNQNVELAQDGFPIHNAPVAVAKNNNLVSDDKPVELAQDGFPISDLPPEFKQKLATNGQVNTNNAVNPNPVGGVSNYLNSTPITPNVGVSGNNPVQETTGINNSNMVVNSTASEANLSPMNVQEDDKEYSVPPLMDVNAVVENNPSTSEKIGTPISVGNTDPIVFPEGLSPASSVDAITSRPIYRGSEEDSIKPPIINNNISPNPAPNMNADVNHDDIGEVAPSAIDSLLGASYGLSPAISKIDY